MSGVEERAALLPCVETLYHSDHEYNVHTSGSFFLA